MRAEYATGADVPSGTLAEDLLRDHGVALAPGAAFGPAGEGHLRISFHRHRRAARGPASGDRCAPLSAGPGESSAQSCVVSQRAASATWCGGTRWPASNSW